MKYNTLPSQTSTSLLRSLGMLVQQAGMYGMSHNVTTLAIREAFEQLESALALYGTIEMAVAGKTLLVNGMPLDSQEPSVHNFSSRIQMHKLGGVVFAPETNEEEFLIFTQLISSSTMALAQLGGMKNALDNAGLRSILSTTEAYKKVSETEPEPPHKPILPKQQGTLVLDLSEALASADPLGAFANTKPESTHEGELDALKQKRLENATRLAAMLRATAALIETGGMLPGELGQQQILASIERMLKVVEISSRETKNQIAKLAGQVDADRQTIASIESAARRRGVGFNLTRMELLAHYAEINQEMLQPVTVSSGVLDLLLSEKSGELTPSQKELIKLATESMQRVNQLVEFTTRISGLPDSFAPDKDLVKNSYS